MRRIRFPALLGLVFLLAIPAAAWACTQEEYLTDAERASGHYDDTPPEWGTNTDGMAVQATTDSAGDQSPPPAETERPTVQTPPAGSSGPAPERTTSSPRAQARQDSSRRATAAPAPRTTVPAAAAPTVTAAPAPAPSAPASAEPRRAQRRPVADRRSSAQRPVRRDPELSAAAVSRDQARSSAPAQPAVKPLAPGRSDHADATSTEMLLLAVAGLLAGMAGIALFARRRRSPSARPAAGTPHRPAASARDALIEAELQELLAEEHAKATREPIG